MKISEKKESYTIKIMVLRPGPDPVNHELLDILVLLILRISLREKSMESLEPQLDHTI